MIHSFSFPADYAWVLLAVVGTAWLTIWQTFLVAYYRKKAGIEYPQAYAEKAEVQASKDALIFNCAQRAHMNTMEMFPQTLTLLLLSGLMYPIPTASGGGLWLVGRVLYTLGYTTGIPSKRRNGAVLSEVALFGLLFSSTWGAAQLVLANIKF